MTDTPKIQWWPDSLVDEIVPPGHTDPAQWITRADDGAFRCGVLKGDPYFSDQEGQIVTDGDQIKFQRMTHLGVDNIILYPDGRFEPDDVQPTGANNVWERGDIETVADTMANFADGMREFAQPDGTPFEVEFARWDDHLFTLRIVDGQPRLEPVSTDGGTHG
ncbi:hypothetical protein GCM10007301_15090 [Azorhizobium oxalatiphilum]|uniref:Uncharacterized protein n=1 Tax=Azorhizobium oxalatiphilum TaxID=980631 RepID=A0A917F8X3_9HYPH|nr:hypothetical protein [Azorhizobium oxalatiphilum]GGF56416.1 hypothetical protein GCM10007301_15090 [Azorhizobium oxalatiphilum]